MFGFMKLLLLISFLITSSLLSLGQVTRIDTVKYKPLNPILSSKKNISTSDYNYAVGIKIFSLEQFPKILNQVDSYQFRESFFNGIIAKINDNQLSYRLSGSFFRKNISFTNECKNCETATGKLTDYFFKIGFEKNLTYSRLQPYYGIDLGFRKNLFNGTSSGAINTTSNTSYAITAEKNSAILSPVLGLKYNVIDHFVFSVESSVDLLLDHERQSKKYNDASNTFSNQSRYRWDLLQKPVGFLSIQYYFSSNY